MKIFVAIGTYNTSQTFVDCAFSKREDAEQYVAALNSDKEKGVARCKEQIALQEGDAMVAFLDEKGIRYEVVETELK